MLAPFAIIHYYLYEYAPTRYITWNKESPENCMFCLLCLKFKSLFHPLK